MRIYRVRALDTAGNLVPDSVDDEYCIFRKWKIGSPENITLPYISADWVNQSIKELPDVIPIRASGTHLVVSVRCKRFIENLSESDDQWLKVVIGDEQMWLYRPLNVIDAVDEAQSDIQRLPQGRVLRVNSYVFTKGVSVPDSIFLTSTKPYDLLCGPQFKAAVRENGWTGFHFAPVWDDKFDPFPLGPTREDIAARPEIFGPEGIVKGFEDAWPDEWR